MDETQDPLDEKIQQVVDDQQPKRLTQLDYMPGSVKNRHVGEGVNALRVGTADVDVSAGTTPTLGQVLTAISATAATFQSFSSILPAGIIAPYGGTSAPTGYLLCDGTSYLRTDYAALFTAIGTAYGTADGTHFNVPDLRGRFLRGVDGGIARDPDRAGRTAPATGGNTGDAVGSVETDAIQGHFHNTKWYGSTYAPGAQPTTGSGAINNGKVASADGADVGGGNDLAVTTPASDGTNGTPRTTSETRPININVQYIIKT